jgi:excinuclease UvrABC nuclease subunit
LDTHSEEPAERESDGRGAPKGNTNRAKAAAWADDFFEGFLTQEEQRRVKEGVEVLGDDAGAQELGRFAAMLALEQFRRTGDERFLRRYESLCDKFQIAPAEEIEVNSDVEHTFGDDVTAEFVTFDSDDDEDDDG